MKNPFESNFSIHGELPASKNLAFEEAYMGLQMQDAEVLEDEREQINYRILGIIIFLCFASLFARIFFLQGIKGSEYRALAEGNKLRVQYVLAPRGLLLDQYGKVIAGNSPSFELVAVTADLPKDKTEFDGRITQIASVLGKSTDELLEAIKKMAPDSFSAQTLSENLTKDQALILMAKAEDLKGFVVQNNPIRDYKDAMAFAHLTGYTGKITKDELSSRPKNSAESIYILNDYIGKTGIEFQYEDYLHGLPGKKQAEVDAEGRFKRTLAEVPSQPGNNVQLNIDYDLQKKIYDSMIEVMAKFKAKNAAAVATNPQTGAVLGLVSLPGFDSNMFARGIKNEEYSQLIKDPNIPLLNRTISGTYPPGSTIKPMMAVAALSEGVVTPQTRILDDGVIRIGNYTFYGYERSGLGYVDIYDAIAKSSDIYFYTVGGGNPKNTIQGMGPEKIAEWFRKFRMGAPLGIDLPSEKSGLVPDPDWKQRVKKEAWFLGDTYHEAIGQGDVLNTPLQVNSWTATIANGGKVMQPYILNRVTDKNGLVVATGKPKVLAENLFDPNIIKVVQDGMRQTVTVGSGRSLSSIPMEVSGKTGTAQFDARDLSRTHSWFTSYAPSNNPQIAFTVIVEGAGEGHEIAVPISKAVYEWWAENRWNK